MQVKTGPGVHFPIRFHEPLQEPGFPEQPLLLYLPSNSCSRRHTWVSAAGGTLPAKLNEILLANVLPRNQMKIFQKQPEAFLKGSRNHVWTDQCRERSWVYQLQ